MHCPRCREEFIASVSTCPDCEVPLTEALEAEVDGSLEPFLFSAKTPELHAELKSILEQASFPHRDVDRGLEVPRGLMPQLVPALESRFEIEADDDQAVLVREWVSEPSEEPPSLEVLQCSMEDLEQAAETRIPELTRLVSFGRQGAAAALLRLTQLGRRGLVNWVDLLIAAIRAESMREASAYATILKEEGVLDAPLYVAEIVPSLSGSQLLIALHVLSRLPDRRVAPFMLPLLEHESEEVRDEADEVLCWVAEADMGFEAAGDPEARSLAVSRWQQWVDQNC